MNLDPVRLERSEWQKAPAVDALPHDTFLQEMTEPLLDRQGDIGVDGPMASDPITEDLARPSFTMSKEHLDSVLQFSGEPLTFLRLL